MKIALFALLAGIPTLACAQNSTSPSAPATTGETQVAVTFNGGHDTVGVDRGRPVILIASALNVPPEVFRKVFSGVHPAGPGSGGPTNEEAQKNKQVLMEGLGPYGVTDDRLNEVSNYYRYRRDTGELWQHADATATATVRNGVVTAITVTNPGAGYSSQPTISVPGVGAVNATVTIAYGTDLDKNGSIKDISLNNAPKAP